MLNEHLTAERISAWRKRQITGQDRLEVVRHLAECEACRALAGSADAAARVLEAIDGTTEHVSYEELEALADGRADAGDRERFAVHFESCRPCAAEYEDLKAFSRSLKPVKENRIKGYLAVGSLVAAGLLVGAVVMQKVIDRTVRQDQARQERSAPQMPTVLAVSLRDAAGLVGLDASGKLQGLSGLSAEQRALVRQVLQTGNLPAGPDSMSTLKRSREVLLGASPGGAEGPGELRPMGAVVPGNHPTFTWKAPPGATRFVVSVYTTNFEAAAKSPELAGSAWLCDKPLADGASYVWTVSATVGGKRVVVPRSPEPEARFRVATAAERQEMEAVTSQSQPSDLLQAATAAKLGMFDVARAALSRLEAANPGSPLVTSLSQTLK